MKHAASFAPSLKLGTTASPAWLWRTCSAVSPAFRGLCVPAAVFACGGLLPLCVGGAPVYRVPRTILVSVPLAFFALVDVAVGAGVDITASAAREVSRIPARTLDGDARATGRCLARRHGAPARRLITAASPVIAIRHDALTPASIRARGAISG